MGKFNLSDRRDEIEALVVLSQNGDKAAFSEIYEIMVDPIYKYIFYRVSDDDVEDLLANVFVKVWQGIGKYKTKQGKFFTAWVFRIAHNIVIDYYKRNSLRDIVELDETLTADGEKVNPSFLANRGLDAGLVRKAIASLKKAYRDVVVYKFISGFSNSEISEILGKSEGSIRVLQFRALAALREKLEKLGIDGF